MAKVNLRKSNFTVEKPEKHYITQMVKVNINNRSPVLFIGYDENDALPL